MKEVLFLLDFACPLFFFFLGRALHGKKRRILVNESLANLCVAVLFAPIVYFLFPLAVQSAFSAGILFLQFFLLSVALVQNERKKKKILLFS